MPVAGPRTEWWLRPWKTVVLSAKVTSRWCLKRGSQRYMARSTVCIYIFALVAAGEDLEKACSQRWSVLDPGAVKKALCPFALEASA